MEYLIRFRQMHETFRQPEIEALAEMNNFTIEWLSYTDDVGSIPHRHFSQIDGIYSRSVYSLNLPFAIDSILTIFLVAFRHHSLFRFRQCRLCCPSSSYTLHIDLECARTLGRGRRLLPPPRGYQISNLASVAYISRSVFPFRVG